MANIISDSETSIVFYIDGTPMQFYFMVKKNGDVYALIRNKGDIRVLPLKEFIDDCWDDFFIH